MSSARQVIALVGVGNLGKYICEELVADDRFDLVVISRRVIPTDSSLPRFTGNTEL
jgi:predicted dinucleotide-utilizing enzyme